LFKPVNAAVLFEDSRFTDLARGGGVLLPGISDVEVAVTGSKFREVAFGVDVFTSGPSIDGQAIGYPASVPSQVTVSGSRFADTVVAAVWVEELGPSLIDLKVVDNALVLAAASQAGIVGFNVEGARVRHNDVAGVGYAGVVA
jgi:hypothetical protein